MTPSIRRTALVLHGLAREDRRWMLERFPAEQREALHGLLEELKQLGVPSESVAEIDGLVSDAQAVDHSHGASVQALLRLDRTAVQLYCLKESDWVVAQVLLAAPFGWRQSVLAEMPVDRRRHLESCCDDVKKIEGPLAAALLERFCDAVRAQDPTHSTADASPPQRKGVRRWLRSFAHHA